MLTDWLAYDFMRNALLASVLVSIACGIIGTLVVLNRIVFISGGIAHAAYGGVGIAYYFGIDPIIGAIAFSVLSALGMGWVHRRQQERADTIIGVMWAMGIGIIFLSLSPGYKADLMSYLFGSILAVSMADLWLMGLIAGLVALFVVLFYRMLLSISFDVTFSTVRNLPVSSVYLAMITLISLTVVISMRVVGLIMVIALLTIPPAVANLFLKDMAKIMLAASLIAVLNSVLGLMLSYALNLPSGAAIILLLGLCYIVAAIISSLRSKPKPVAV